MTSTPDEITRLLIAWNQGDKRARDELTPLIYDELRRLARGPAARLIAGFCAVNVLATRSNRRRWFTKLFCG